MQNIFIELLPPWIETGLQPAFYDKESGTVLQQVSRMWAKMIQLGEAFNTFSEDTATFVNQFVDDTNETVDDYIEKFNDLHDYVYDYFDNLDVQEEINNKLDQMVEAGTLQEIIDAYLDSNITWTFDTVADMKAATNLIDGSDAKTLGFYSINDGGGATYHITDTGTANEMDVIAVNGLYAVLKTDEANIKQFGAKGDGTSNDSSYFVRALDYAMDNDYTVKVPTGTYLLSPNIFQAVSKTGTYNNLSIEGVGKTQSVLKLNNTTTGQYFSDSTSKQLYAELNFRNIGFTGNDHTANGFYCYSTGTEKRFRFYNCWFELANVLYCAGTGNADLHRFENCNGHIYGNFITLDNAQSVETELYGTSLGFYENGQFIKYYKGGCVHIFGGEYETFGTTNDWLLDFSEATESMGVGNIGIAFTGTRFEFHNQHKFINATGNRFACVSFTDCNMGTADVLSTGYYVELTKNANIKFERCSIGNNVKFHVYTTGTVLADSVWGAILEFKDCIIGGRLYNNVTAEGAFSRVIAKGCVNTVMDGIRGSNDFDWNWQQRSDGVISASSSVNALKRTGEGWPKAGDEFTFTIPPNCFVKRIKIYRPAISGSTASYVLHVGNSDKSVVYGETAGTSIFNDEINIDVENIGFVSDNVIKVWATGSATNITTQGYGYIEYILSLIHI